jgi:hypothetical protein
VEVHQIDLGGVSGAGGTALRLDDNGLIDMGWAQAMQNAQAMDFCRGLRTDSAVPLARDLNYVLQFVRDNYRPLKYATVLQSEAIPDWAERWEVSKITGTGSVQLASQVGRSDIVTSDFSRDTATGRVFEIVNGYKYWMRELIRSAKLGINPQVERAMIQAQAAEEFLDALVATGLVGSQYGSGGARDLGLGLTGLGNDANVVADGMVLGTTKTSTNSAWKGRERRLCARTRRPAQPGLGGLHPLEREAPRRHHGDAARRVQRAESPAPRQLRGQRAQTFEKEWQKRVGKPVRFIVWDRFAAIGTMSTGPAHRDLRRATRTSLLHHRQGLRRRPGARSDARLRGEREPRDGRRAHFGLERHGLPGPAPGLLSGASASPTVTVTVASFKVAYPEFGKAGDAMLEAALVDIELEVSDDFGDSRDAAVMLRLADRLALSPSGRDARLDPKKATSSTYGERFQAMASALAVSATRCGSPPHCRRDD